MKRWCRAVRLLVAAMTLSCLLVMFGCEGTDTRNQVDDSVQELAGKKQVERMKEMKEDLEHIQTQQSQRLDQLEDAQ
jgi:outer membrane murein-binding lipoprotein Lpp